MRYISYDKVVNYLGDLDIEVLKDSLDNSIIKSTKCSKLIYHSLLPIATENTPLIKISAIYETNTKGLSDKEFEDHKRDLISQVDVVVRKCLRAQSIIFN